MKKCMCKDKLLNNKDQEKISDIGEFIRQSGFFKWTKEQEKDAFKTLQILWKGRGIE